MTADLAREPDLHVLGHSAVAGGIGFPAFFKAVS